ncbi:MAG: hypothetical protein IKU86_12215 [Thermoguttaceae bacterium]|nr:hypothetical protein [Thermoguttaceae bacterium]
MITLDSVIEFVETTKTIDLGGEKATIRKLDGVDRLRAPTNSVEALTLHVIANGLLDGKTGKPVGKDFAYKLVRGQYLRANAIYTAILKFTTEGEDELKEALEAAVEAEKNGSLPSEELKFSGGDTANVTDSTPQPLV